MADNNATNTTEDGQRKQVHSPNGIRNPSFMGTKVILLRASWHTSHTKPKKFKNIHHEKNSRYFMKGNFLALILKKKKIIFPEMKPCLFQPQLSKFFPKKICYIFP